MTQLPYQYGTNQLQTGAGLPGRNGWGVTGLIAAILAAALVLLMAVLSPYWFVLQRQLDLPIQAVYVVTRVTDWLKLVIAAVAVLLSVIGLLQKRLPKRAAAAGLGLGGVIVAGFLTSQLGHLILSLGGL
ncbi:hypothetical protein [Psychromicrobium lacuslunae]|uniref:Uncharacterized protein n=1 Tax=Psychromicrobium lacuslunae TaxID=1618207 RepID=A0A0D4BW15_9MICC|nr:hypothetical protein [Psychromicrobium lacuslunae]AJT40637.1 hypothetical protein UM93_02170 [Psychromicrobium lacuslunae]